jgi:N-hydroxyarylamine O-acetyltransferase
MKLTPALQNYLLDLGLGVPETPNLDFVKQLQAKHLERYSFNNLAVLLGQSIPLDLQAISEKIVAQRLGGYCFEHNKLTYELLKSLGFNVQLKLARVLNNNFEREAARTHRVTLVTIDGDTYLVDTGFGGNGPIAPLQLNNASEQAGGLYRYRLFERENGEFDLQLVGGDSYFTLYRFDLADYNDADCEAGHLYSHKHPKAVFVNNLMVTLKKS